MKMHSMAIASALLALAVSAGAARAADIIAVPDDERDGVKVGLLECDVAGGMGYILGSAKSLSCVFHGSKGRVEAYTGNINKLGVDLGWTTQGRLTWAVFAPVAGYHRGALAGTYVGATAEATVIAGVGANVLLGGMERSVALQLVSVTGQLGLNAAAGLASLMLVPAS